ncbi:MAG: hypothetical protein FD166_817 [Bacteroidetes bacterium]|nr:MAG: hypothetical protein FD166_817 [Bacteroidota bacterium]
MKARYFIAIPLLLAIVSLTQSFSGDTGLKYPTGAPAGHTGSPGDAKNCTICHGGTATNVTGVLTSDVPETGYVAGSTYNFTVTLTGNGRKGFQASPQNVAGTQLGTLIAGSGTLLNGNGKYITHSQASTAATKTWNFQWTAPAPGTGTVTMYIARVISQPNVGLSSLVLNENFSVGIENAVKTNTRIYPNPAGKLIFAEINLNTSGRVIADAYNLNGQKQETLYEGELNAGRQSVRISNNLKPGYYILRLTTPDGTINEKLIIN